VSEGEKEVQRETEQPSMRMCVGEMRQSLILAGTTSQPIEIGALSVCYKKFPE